MSLSVGVARVREKVGLTATDYDTEIQALIYECLPAVEYAVKPEHVAESSNSGLQATLNLGAVEVVAGEFFAQLCRKPGVAEAVVVGGLEVRPFIGPDASDPSGMKRQGWERLRPYLRVDPVMVAVAGVSVARGKRDVVP